MNCHAIRLELLMHTWNAFNSRSLWFRAITLLTSCFVSLIAPIRSQHIFHLLVTESKLFMIFMIEINFYPMEIDNLFNSSFSTSSSSSYSAPHPESVCYFGYGRVSDVINRGRITTKTFLKSGFEREKIKITWHSGRAPALCRQSGLKEKSHADRKLCGKTHEINAVAK